MSDEKVRWLVSAIFDPKHRATRGFVSAAIHTLLDEARRAAFAEAERLREALRTIERTGGHAGTMVGKRADEHSCAWCRGYHTPCPVSTASNALAKEPGE